MAANTRSKAISGTSLDVSETTDTLEIQLIRAAIEDPYLAALMTGDVHYIDNFIRYQNYHDVGHELMHGFTPLMIASLHGQFEAVKSLVDEGADVNKTYNNKTALMLAATFSIFELERVYTRKALLPVTSEMGADTLFTSSDSIDDKVSLLKRILEKKTQIIECLLQAGADPNTLDEDGRNALILLTVNNLSKCLGSMFQGSVPAMIMTVANTELVKRCQCLIKYGVDINTTDSDRMTALMHAVRNRLNNVCEILLDSKADVDIVDNNENTALTFSVLTGSKYLSRLLLQRGAKLLTHEDLRRVVPSQDLLEKSCEICKLLNGDDTNMDGSIVSDTNSAITQDSIGLQITDPTVCLGVDTSTTLWNILSAVCCRKAVRNQKQITKSDNINNSLYPVTDDLNNNLGQAILLSAVTKKSFEVCKFALDHGANPNIKDNDKNAVLIHAILVRSVDICNLLLHYGADPPHLSDAVGKTLLMHAVSQDLTEFADVLISYYGEDVNLQDVTGTTALMYAITCKVDDCCQLLLRHGADVNIQYNFGITALMFAISTNYDRGIQWLIENNADLNVQDMTGRTALMYAAMNNSTQSCKLLVESKADLNIQDKDGMTAVLYCAQKSLMDPLKVLLSGGANPDLCDNKGMSALMYTVVNNSPDCCKLLVDHGANINIQDPDGWTALMLCDTKTSEEVLKILISGGANLEIKDREGHTALWYAVVYDGPEMCKLLVESKADLNIQDKDGMTAVLYCAQKSLMDSLKVLLSGGANPDLCDNKGMSALMYTVVNNSPDCCKLLVDHGANINIQDQYGRTALMYCFTKKLEELLKILISRGANLEIKDREGHTALWYAVENNRPDFCKLLVDHGADVNSQDKSGTTPVMLCCGRHFSQKDCLDILLTGKPDLEIKDREGHTALWYAVENNRPDFCKLLVDHGADVNSQDKSGTTPVMLCLDRYHFNKDCLDILLTGKPDLNIINQKHETALMKASCKNISDICEILVCHGADVNIRDSMGMSAMMHAVFGNSYSKCVEYFLSLGVDPNEQISHPNVPDDNDGSDANAALKDLGWGKSAFQLAVILDFDDLCRLMMSNGADVNKQDRDGRTALMYSVLHDSSKCFSLLLECADLTVEDNEGRTVMSYATKAEYIQKLQAIGLEDRKTGKEETVSVFSLLIKDVNFFLHLQLDQRKKFRFFYSPYKTIECVLENGASPILEPCELSLLHKCNILLLYTEDIEDFSLYSNESFHIQNCIVASHKQFLRLLVCNGVVPASGSQSSNGVVPASGSQSSTHFTVFQTVLKYGDKDIFKYLIANCYLTDQDVAYMRNPGRNARRRSIDYTLDDSDDNEDNHDNDYNDDNNNNMQVPEEMFQHPWPLVKLAFISVSTAVGGGPGREARVSKTGLPVKLQDMLMFRQPSALIPVREWEDIELCFDPVKYEELPRPRPLLYYWPLGRQV